MKQYYLHVADTKLRLDLDDTCHLYTNFSKQLPLGGKGHHVAGEVYFMVELDLPYDGSERETFEVGDLVYWRSSHGDKFAIAIFYGNTRHGDGTLPRAASAAIKIGRVNGSCEDLAKLAANPFISIEAVKG